MCLSVQAFVIVCKLVQQIALVQGYARVCTIVQNVQKCMEMCKCAQKVIESEQVCKIIYFCTIVCKTMQGCVTVGKCVQQCLWAVQSLMDATALISAPASYHTVQWNTFQVAYIQSACCATVFLLLKTKFWSHSSLVLSPAGAIILQQYSADWWCIEWWSEETGRALGRSDSNALPPPPPPKAFHISPCLYNKTLLPCNLCPCVQ